MSLGRSFSALTGASAISMVAQLVRGKLAALVLGPAGVGVFNQLSTLWNLLNVAGGLGSFVGVVQHGAEAISKADDLALRRLSSTFVLLLGIVSCVLTLLGVLMSARLSDWALHDGGRHADLVSLILLSVPLAVTAQTYHALLAAGRAVRSLAVTQIITDLGAMLVFAVLIFPFGLSGAIAGFIATYVIMLIAKGIAVRRRLGSGLVRPRVRDFDWGVVRSNVGFGASGLLMIALTNLAILIVSRIIIQRLGVEANGIFSNAWRLASVYLASVTATSFAYLVPTLNRCPSDAAMAREVNSAVRFYLLILPLPMAVVMTGGEFLVWLILSREFLPAAALLLLFVPAELLRVISDSVAVTLMVRRKIAWFTMVSASQFVVFLAGAVLLIPSYGLVGAALAYLLSYGFSILLSFLLARLFFGLAPERTVLWQMLVSGLLLAGIAFLAVYVPFGPQRIAGGAALGLCWLGLTLLNPEARTLALGWIGQLRTRPAL